MRSNNGGRLQTSHNAGFGAQVLERISQFLENESILQS